MTANINDKIDQVTSGVRPVSTTVKTIRNSGGTTLSCNDLTGWTTATKVHFVTYKKASNGSVVAGSQIDCTGIVSGSDINSLVITGGTDAGNVIGDIVELLPTAQYGKDLADMLLAEHKQSGAHSAMTADSLSVATTSAFTGVATFAAAPVVPDGSFSQAKLVSKVSTIASAATITPSNQEYFVTALATAATIAAPSLTPTDGMALVIRIKDDGTARALTWNAIYRVIGVTLPTTTVAGKAHYIGAIYNSSVTKWDVLSVSKEA